MHILEQYAVNCGAKISEPFILKEYFPIPFDKYIVLHAGSGMESKNYDYFNEVVQYIKPYLDSQNIHIVQIGGPKEKQIRHCYNALGTTKRQMAHIIDNSLLYFGNDTMSLHFASYFKKKIVCTSTVLHTSCFYPYWSDKKDYTIIESHRNGKKPTFSAQESPKTINLIKPEEIALPILEYLGYNNVKLPTTIFTGDKYIYPVLECLPKQVLPPNMFPNQMVNIRIDYSDDNDLNLEPIAHNLSIRPCALITDRPLMIESLQNLFKNIQIIIYDITKGIDLDFVKKINFFGLKYVFVFRKTKDNESELNQRKLDLLDTPHVLEEISQDSNLLSKFNDQDVILRSSKILIGNDQFYSSRAAQLENKPSELMDGYLEIENKNIINKDNLIIDIDHLLMYKK
jgi:hypothetical protein